MQLSAGDGELYFFWDRRHHQRGACLRLCGMLDGELIEGQVWRNGRRKAAGQERKGQ